jgi:ubiquitin-like protein Pup
VIMRLSISEDVDDDSVDSDGSSDMAAKDTSSQPQTAGRAEDTGEAEVAGPGEASTEKASTEEAGERSGNPPGDVGEILDDMDEALEENAEEIVRSFVQQGGQ